MKRLAIFLDGTWNTLNNNTNVWRLKSLCVPSTPDQLIYYGEGVGTRVGEKVRGGAMGFGIDHEIIDAYTWLVQVFAPGDEIFIFGFSRGAYAARSLSGLISTCGVLEPGAPLSIQQLYARYRRPDHATINQLVHAKQESVGLEERWIVKYCHQTPIKMVGVWDTVGSLGNPLEPMRGKVAKYRFLDTHLRLSNEFAFQALAVDEHRKPFEPTLWTKTTDNAPSSADPRPRPLASVEQRWFVGAHANVGGGYPSDILAQPPLKWLMDKAAAHGLEFHKALDLDPLDPLAPIADSYAEFGPRLIRPAYHLFSPPFYRPIGTDPARGTTRTTERINETIDGSVFERWRNNPQYRPPNLQEWAVRKKVDPVAISGSCLAADPQVEAA
jgi:uncharacterized protein (DUF2235 family)